MAALCYVDTSALVKRYVAEPGSAEFDLFCERDDLERIIGPLVATEFVGVLQRRVRGGTLKRRYATEARGRFNDELASGGWRMIDFETLTFAHASQLMTSLPAPLATLDALHLACAVLAGAASVATADKQLATAARHTRLEVFGFY